MENINEIYKALLDGKKITHIRWMRREYIHIVDGMVLEEEGDPYFSFFDDCEHWELYKEPQWYDNIPEGGVLCKNEINGPRGWEYILVTDYYQGDVAAFVSNIGYVGNVTPLTKEEIQVFMDNVPNV